MKKPFIYIAIRDHLNKLLIASAFKNIQIGTEGKDKGFISYEVDGKVSKIPPIDDPHKVVTDTAAGLLIMEGYCVTTALDDTSIVSNDKGDTYFVNGTSCSCPDVYAPCKHVLLSKWYKTFRKNQVLLLHKTMN